MAGQAGKGWTAAQLGISELAVHFVLPISGPEELPNGPSSNVEMRGIIRAAVERHVFHDRGFIILRTPETKSADVESLLNHATYIARALGSVMAQSVAGNVVAHVIDSGRTISDGARYHETREGGGLHTDGPQLDIPPDVVIMGCVNKASHGGATLLASAQAIHDRLAVDAPDLLALLHETFYFDRRGFGSPNGQETIARSVFECTDTQTQVRYLRQYIQSGYDKQRLSLSDAQTAALEKLDSLLGEPEFVWQVMLEPGDILVLNNRTICHGRTAFVDDANLPPRHLVRIWVARDQWSVAQ